ncbi:cation-independent mannose-6-phosphate receptor-like [Xenia sp. Carnegie-2017]|uniref:cation-independent mannose-6-phosphate receptor-like n=1 Tax=Xenia sp. Carnegie-2017 TaxID=2897299 RepID=UPI001F043698|nr:cation-independent mannose-6-phosphate receptor-like [Xenia sp. Carnegie-2017]
MNQYKINICGVVEGCPGTSSICKNDKSKKPTSLGNVNTQLQYRQGFLFLHYTNGDMCVPELGRKMETMITFICDSSAGRGSPVIEKTGDCTHFVTWKTDLTCEAEVDCVAHDGKTFYDLTPLVRNNANYELYYENRRFIVNVCRSLVQGSGCPANAAVCQTGSKKSLGKVSGPPRITKEGKVRLNYTDGSCTTTITFICNQLLNEQVITQAKGCNVSISWSTTLVCARPYANNSCIFVGPKGDYCFDLRNLGWSESITATIPKGNLIHFSQCGKRIKKCGKEDKRPFEACLKMAGKNATSLIRKGISYNGSEVRIDYDDAVLVLYCGENQNSNTPLYIGQYAEANQLKRYLFSLITPAVCPPRQFACEVKHGKKTYNLNGLADHREFSVSHHDTVYLISICGHVRFTPKTGVCSSRATTVRIKDGGEPEIISVDNNYSLTYQENEEYPIRLVYNGSQSIDLCGGKLPSVVHKFKCAGIIPGPSFKGFDKTNCQFTFWWQTYEACAEQRSALRKTGDWRFSDKKAANCELDLYFLKKEIPKCERITSLQLFAHKQQVLAEI